MIEIEDFFKEDGILQQNFDCFEYRPAQIEMGQLVKKAIDEKQHTLFEAGTGTGKSFAYLIPLILYSKDKKQSVVVSTNTKSLQQQMINKDLPFLKSILNKYDLDFSFKIFYGSGNYICKYKAERFLQSQKDLFTKQEMKEYLEKYVHNNHSSGIRYDMKYHFPASVWENINRDSDLCLRKTCTYYKDCFYYRNLKELYTTNIIVINHSLFFANVASGFQILPPFHIFVWDEAHNIEDVASKFLAHEINEKTLDFIFKQMTSLPGRIESNTESRKNYSDYIKSIKQIQKLFHVFFDYYRSHFKNNVRIKNESLPKDILDPYNNFLSKIKIFLKSFENHSEEIDLEIDVIYKRLKNIKDNLSFFLFHKDEDYVYWVEISGRRKRCTLKFTPINIAEYLNSKVFKLFDTAILTSATLSTNQNFDFIKSRLGLSSCIEMIFPSPFNFQRQVQLYMNKYIHKPDEYDLYLDDLNKEIQKLLRYNRGRAFVLFTSYQTLNQTRQNIENTLDYQLLSQNSQSFDKLIKEFKRDIHSVLMGTMSFWEGVDVPGEALSLVIITRLPFDVPDEPLISARIEYIRKHNGNPFIEYQLPNAIILLKQGFGRLIRNASDKGMVAILDSRILTKSYGQLFLRSLPECEVITEL